VGRENYPLHWVENAHYPWGKAEVLATGNDVVILACGPLVGRAIDAGRELKEKNISATVIANPFVNRVDLETIGPAVQRCSGRVVTIEDHQIICGMGAQVSHALALAGITHRMKSLGIEGEFGRSAYVAEDLYKAHGLTAEKIIDAARELMK
jgi:transketolase